MPDSSSDPRSQAANGRSRTGPEGAGAPEANPEATPEAAPETTPDATPDADPPYDYHAELNDIQSGFNACMQLRFRSATLDEVVAEVPVADHLLQPYGLVHGGVYSAMIETACSTGAALFALGRGQHTVGLDNTTSFLRAVRQGTLTVRATPLVRGRRSHVWEGRVTDDRGRLAAAGRVRLLVLDAGDEAAGEAVTLKTDFGDQ